MKITQDENIDYMVIIEILIEQLKEKVNQIHELHILIVKNQAQDIYKN